MSANENTNQRGEPRPPINKPSRVRQSDDKQDPIQGEDNDRPVPNDNSKTWPLFPFPDDWSS
jgi:hypothetical protein